VPRSDRSTAAGGSATSQRAWWNRRVRPLAIRRLGHASGASAQYLADNLERVPVLVIPVIKHRIESTDNVVMASHFGSVLPAVRSFMLAARARGLGRAWTTIHLFYEREAAQVLGIPQRGGHPGRADPGRLYDRRRVQAGRQVAARHRCAVERMGRE